MQPTDHALYQQRYFDVATNQYPQDAIRDPPLHTILEIQSILTRLDGIPPGARVVDFGSGTGRLSIPLAKARILGSGRRRERTIAGGAGSGGTRSRAAVDRHGGHTSLQRLISG
jgi:hypothetical protein